jgi:hypothetical protein
MRINLFILGIIASLQFACHQDAPDNENSHAQKRNQQTWKVNGCVPDEATAKKIAEAVWLPIYGKGVLDEKPYKAELTNDSICVIQGSLSRDMLGGVAYIEIRKKDCAVLNITHTK